MVDDPYAEDLNPFPELWVATSGDKMPIRRMLDDFIRQGWNDDRITTLMKEKYIEYILQVGIRKADVDWLRARQDIDYKGVPSQNRPAFRERLVKALGRSYTPWDMTGARYGSNSLDLTNLNISELPVEIFKKIFADELKSLDLQHNQLVQLPPQLGQLTNLESLKAGHNVLEVVCPEIGKLWKLKTLALSHNRLRSLPPEMSKLRVEALFLDYNRLEFLPPSIVRLTNLTDLRINNNDELKCPPKNIQTLGRKAVFSYLRNLDSANTAGVLNLQDLGL